MVTSGVEHSLGSGINNLRYTASILTLTYYHGSSCPSDSSSYSSTIRFICSDSINEPQFILKDVCTYFFDWHTPAACHSSTKTQRCNDISFGQSR